MGNGVGRVSGIRPRTRSHPAHHLRLAILANSRTKLNNDFRALLASSLVPRRSFPQTRIGPYKDSEAEIELTRQAAFGWRPLQAAR